MNLSAHTAMRKMPRPAAAALALALLALPATTLLEAREPAAPPAAPPPAGANGAGTTKAAALARQLALFRERSVASVSDAVDQVTGQRGFLSHKMRPVGRLTAKMAGVAVTAIFRHSLEAKSLTALRPALELIDCSGPESVFVVAVEGEPEMTGIGGLMATACATRGFAGAVIDGAARDIDEINALGLPVFSRSISPATVVGRMVSAGENVPVRCGGVTIRPGDILVGGNDGVVVVPAEKAAEVLKAATAIDERETKMVLLIRENRSILKAVEAYNRL